MAKRNSNEKLLSEAIKTAEEIAISTSNEFPIILNLLTKRRRVTEVKFTPLLVDAMLTAHVNGFRIICNSTNYRSSFLEEVFKNESHAKLLNTRIRFSIAHEIAHTLFYSITESPPSILREFKSGGGKTALDNLERNCNLLASYLLLPTKYLNRELEKHTQLQADTLIQLAKKAGVSIETLVRRLGHAEHLLVEARMNGVVVIIQENHEELRIAAVAKPNVELPPDLQGMFAADLYRLKDINGNLLLPANLINLPVVSLRKSQQGHLPDNSLDYLVSIQPYSKFEGETKYLLILNKKPEPSDSDEFKLKLTRD